MYSYRSTPNAFMDARFRDLVFNAAAMTFGKALKVFGGEEAWEGRTGLFFVIADSISGAPLASTLIGEVSDQKLVKYGSFAVEKAQRLSLYAAQGHVTSFESRNPEKNQWGGAILLDHVNAGIRPPIFSVSGAPEDADTAIVLVVAQLVVAVSSVRGDRILKVTNNQHYARLRAAIKDESSSCRHILG